MTTFCQTGPRAIAMNPPRPTHATNAIPMQLLSSAPNPTSLSRLNPLKYARLKS